MTAPRLTELISKCESQVQKADFPTYEYPEELLSVSTMQTLAGGDVEFSVSRKECENVRRLDAVNLFGEHWLLSKAKAKAKAKVKAKAKAIIKIHLSEREKRIVKRLGEHETENQD